LLPLDAGVGLDARGIGPADRPSVLCHAYHPPVFCSQAAGFTVQLDVPHVWRIYCRLWHHASRGDMDPMVSYLLVFSRGQSADGWRFIGHSTAADSARAACAGTAESNRTGWQFIATPDGTLLAANPAFIRTFGVPEHGGGWTVPLTSLFPTNEAYGVFLQRIREEKRLQNYEAELRRLDGTPVYVVENVLGTFDDRGELVEIKGYIFDNSERHYAEEALRDREARLQAVMAHAVDGIITINEHGVVESFNPAAERLFGYPCAEVIGHNVSLLMPPPYREEHDGYIDNALKTGVTKIIGIGREVVGLRKDGTTFPLDLSVSDTRLGDRRLFTGIVRDLSERKAAEEALRQAIVNALQHAAQLRGLSEAALAVNSAASIEAVLQVTTDRARIIIGARQAVTRAAIDQSCAQAITAVSVSEKHASRRPYDEHPDDSGIDALVCRENRPLRMTRAELGAQPAWRGFGRAQDTHPPMRGWLAAPLIGRDGRHMGVIQLSDKYEGEFTENDESILVQLAQMASVAVENARLYRLAQEAEEELRRQLQFTSAITDNLGEGVYAVDREGRFTFVNPAAESLLGWTRAELLGKHSHELIHRQSTEGSLLTRGDCALLSLMQGQVMLRRAEGVFTRRDGTTFVVAFTSSSIVVDGEVLGAVVAFHDVTERKAVEETMRRQSLLFENMTDGVIIFDREGRITDWNGSRADLWALEIRSPRANSGHYVWRSVGAAGERGGPCGRRT
jgi:PAS domain S-box-containing protein